MVIDSSEVSIFGTGVDRRSLLKRSAISALLLSSGISGCAGETSAVEYRLLLYDIAGLLIPATDTMGADRVGAVDVVLKGIHVGMDGATLAMVGLVQNSLDGASGGSYLKAPLAKRYAVFEAFDSNAYAAAEPNQTQIAWRKIKGLLLIGYYTSEVGGSQELAYELVPGRFDPDVPVTSATRAYSSDWFGASFR
jgi:hypothetical protein